MTRLPDEVPCSARACSSILGPRNQLHLLAPQKLIADSLVGCGYPDVSTCLVLFDSEGACLFFCDF